MVARSIAAPYLRDGLLSAGALCETLETATTWANVGALKAAVTEALTGALADSGTSALVMCHISHVYPTGASLYFTVVAAQRGDAAAQWRSAKRAASDAMVRCGATITHHHAVGADHRPWMRDEIGDLGLGDPLVRDVAPRVHEHGVAHPDRVAGEPGGLANDALLVLPGQDEQAAVLEDRDGDLGAPDVDADQPLAHVGGQ